MSGDFPPISVTQQAPTEDNQFRAWFGPPRGPLYKMDPGEQYAVETNTLPDAYIGRNDYMKNAMISIIKEEDMWLTKKVLPIKITEDRMSFDWSFIYFEKAMMTTVPELGVPRLLKQTKESRHEFYRRSGIAFTVEHGFMNTPEGRENYVLQMEQLRDAVLETIELEGTEALLGSKKHNIAWKRMYGQQANQGSLLRGLLGAEVRNYGLIQKTKYGWPMLDSLAKDYFATTNVQPDTWIIPYKMGRYNMYRPENRSALEAGASGPAAIRRSMAEVNRSSGLPPNSCQVFESRRFDVPGENVEPVDPLRRMCTVGEYYEMTDVTSGVMAPADYRSDHRSIYVFDARRNDFSKISIKRALGACSRFESARGDLYFPPEFQPGSNDRDMFLMPDGHGRETVCTFFGDMKECYLNREVLRRLGVSVKASLGNKVGMDAAEHMKKLFPHSEYFEKNTTADGYDLALEKTTGAAVVKPLFGAPRTHDEDDFKDLLTATRLGMKIFKAGGLPDITNVDDQDGYDRFNTFCAEWLEHIAASKEHPSLNEKSATSAIIQKFRDKVRNSPSMLSDNSLFLFMSALKTIKDKLKMANSAVHGAYAVHKILNWFVGEHSLEAFDSTPALGEAAQHLFQAAADESFIDKLKGKPKDVNQAIDDAIQNGAPVSGGAASLPPPVNARYHYGARKRAAEPHYGRFAKSRMGARIFIDPSEAKRVVPNRKGGVDGGNDDDNAASNEKSSTMKGRLDWLHSNEDVVDAVEKAAIRLFLYTPVNGKALEVLIDRNVYFPFDFLLFRPNITHLVSTAIMLKSGSDTGNTHVGHALFELADDVTVQRHFGTFTIYFRAIVKQPQHVFLAENIFWNGYVGGYDTTFNTLESLTSGTGSDTASMYACLVPAREITEDDMGEHECNARNNSDGYMNPMDVTGKWSDAPNVARLDSELANPHGLLHYATADFYRKMYSFNNQSPQATFEYAYDQMNAFNTVVFQGHQACYNPASKQWDRVTVNTGHMGNVYQGVGDVHDGSVLFLDDVKYDAAFGGKRPATLAAV